VPNLLDTKAMSLSHPEYQNRIKKSFFFVQKI